MSINIETFVLWTNVKDHPEVLDESEKDSLRARVFGQLIKLAGESVKFYHSDFYRDAQNLQEFLHGECNFIYSFGENGTWMFFPSTKDYPIRESAFQCKIYLDGFKWMMSIERLNK